MEFCQTTGEKRNGQAGKKQGQGVHRRKRDFAGNARGAPTFEKLLQNCEQFDAPLDERYTMCYNFFVAEKATHLAGLAELADA